MAASSCKEGEMRPNPFLWWERERRRRQNLGQEQLWPKLRASNFSAKQIEKRKIDSKANWSNPGKTRLAAGQHLLSKLLLLANMRKVRPFLSLKNVRGPPPRPPSRLLLGLPQPCRCCCRRQKRTQRPGCLGSPAQQAARLAAESLCGLA